MRSIIAVAKNLHFSDMICDGFEKKIFLNLSIGKNQANIFIKPGYL